MFQNLKKKWNNTLRNTTRKSNLIIIRVKNISFLFFPCAFKMLNSKSKLSPLISSQSLCICYSFFLGISFSDSSSGYILLSFHFFAWGSLLCGSFPWHLTLVKVYLVETLIDTIFLRTFVAVVSFIGW